MKSIGVSRLPLVIKANGVPNGELLAADLGEKIRQEFGDGFARISAAELALLRDKFYAPAPERVPGAAKVLDLLIGTLDKGAGGTAPEGGVVGQETKDKQPAKATKVDPLAGDPAGDSLQLQAEQLLSILRNSKAVASGSSSAARKPGRRIPLYRFSEHPKVLTLSRLREGSGNLSEFRGCQWSEDGRFVTFTSREYSLHRLDVTTGEFAHIELEPRRRTREFPDLCDPDFVHGGAYVYAHNLYDEVCVWDAKTGKMVVKDVEAKRPGIARLSPDGEWWLTNKEGWIYEQDLETGTLRETRMGKEAGQGTFSPDGKAVLAKVDGRPCLFVRGEQGFEARALEGEQKPRLARFMGYGFSGNGCFAVAGQDEGLCVWDTKTGKLRTVAWSSQDLPRYCAVSNDGRVLAVLENERRQDSGLDASVQLYDIEKGEPLGDPIQLAPRNEGCGLEFSPDDLRLFVHGYPLASIISFDT